MIMAAKLHAPLRQTKRKAPPDRSGGAFIGRAERGLLLFGSAFVIADVRCLERLVALLQVFARIRVGAMRFAFDPGQRIVADRRFRTLLKLGSVLLFRVAGEDQALLSLAPRSTDRSIPAVGGNPQPVHARTGPGGDETADDHVLLQADQRVLLTLDSSLGKHAGRFLERSRRDERTSLQAGLGDPEQHRSADRRLLVPAQLGVDLVHLVAVELFAREQGGVAAVGDLDLLQHLANDHLDVLVVDLHALESIDFLDFRAEVFSQRLHPEHFQNVVRVRASRDQRVTLLDEVVFLDVDDLGLRHQVFDRIALFRDDRDLALGLVVADEFDPAGDLGDNRVVLRHAGLEQLGHTGQTTGDVTGLGGFTRSTSENIAGLDLLAVLDRERRARSEHVARRFGFFALLAAFVAKQGEPRTQILLLGPAGGAV